MSIERFAESVLLVRPGEQEMKEGNDCPFELRATAGVDCRGREGLPDDGFANVGRNEEGNAAAQAVSLLQQFVKENDDQASNDELHN